MPDIEAYTPVSESLILQYRKELPFDLGRLAMTATTAGMLDSPNPRMEQPQPITGSPEATAELITDADMGKLFRQVMGEMTMRRISLDHAVTYANERALS